MNLKGLVYSNRSVRRFKESEKVSNEIIESLIGLARNTPSARNDQPLKYSFSSYSELNNRIFPHLKWAGYLSDWNGPEVGERPSAYILVLGDTEISKTFKCDAGFAMQSILLGAVEYGLNGCIIGSVNRHLLKNELGIPDHLKILYVLALGASAENIILEEIEANGDIRYWRDSEGNHHVPKRLFKDILFPLS